MRGVFVPICISSVLVLAACSSGGGSSSGGTGGSANSRSSSLPTSTLFDLPLDTKVAVSNASASLNQDSGEVRSYRQDFWVKSPETTTEGDVRRLRYGKPFSQYHPKRNYTIPMTVTDSGGQLIGTGVATFSGDDVENGVTTRTINLTDHQLSSSIFGLFSTDDSGTRGNFFEIHAYAGGIDATNLPATATYSGTFIGDVISDTSAGSATRVSLPTDLTVNFDAGGVIGTIGAGGSPDMTLTGTVTGSTMTGNVTLNTGVTALASGSAGTFSGGFFGDGAVEAAGTLGITDATGTVQHELVGAFGATKN